MSNKYNDMFIVCFWKGTNFIFAYIFNTYVYNI